MGVKFSEVMAGSNGKEPELNCGHKLKMHQNKERELIKYKRVNEWKKEWWKVKRNKRFLIDVERKMWEIVKGETERVSSH